ncbi:MAG: GTP-binding protein [Desulfitobacteriaceae bacterium]
MGDSREKLRIVVVGHVDHGKSTVIGRLLYDTKALPEGAIDRVKRISKEKGKPFEYAYLLDAFEEEQKQGITIDITQLQFQTAKRDYVIIDAPGHKEFLKNMVSGAANAEAALLVIDANEGIQEQSRRHGYILSLLGIQKIYVIVNKMDLIDYSEGKFEIIRQEMNEFLSNLNVHPLKYIPISAFYGENMTSSSAKMTWYKGEAVLQALDLFKKDKGLEDKPLRFPIQDVYKFDNRRIIAGRIESGSLKAGDEILINPGNKTTRVKAIEYWQEKNKTDIVSAGMSVGITLEDEFFNKRGEFISHLSDPPKTGNVFRANLFWLGKKAMTRDKKYKLKLVTQEVECEIASINRVIDATTLETLVNATEIKMNDVAEVTLRIKETISFDEFKSNQITGRFVIVDEYDVTGGGIISGVEKSNRLVSRFIAGDLEMVAECFDDYYFMVSEGTFKRISRKPQIFNLGDQIPVEGETYQYPVNLDILDLYSKQVVKVRATKILEIVTDQEYRYENFTIITTKGFLVKISSEQDYNEFVRDFEEQGAPGGGLSEDFLNRWLDVMANKRIKFKENQMADGLEYYI